MEQQNLAELHSLVMGGSDGEDDVIGTACLHNNIISGAGSQPGLRVNTVGGTASAEGEAVCPEFA